MSDAAAVVIRVLASIKSLLPPRRVPAAGGIGDKAATRRSPSWRPGFVRVNSAGAVGLTLAGKNAARLLPRLSGL